MEKPNAEKDIDNQNSKNMKRTIKSQVLDWVESRGHAGYNEIIEFAHDLKYGTGSWQKNPNRRGWYSSPFSRGYVPHSGAPVFGPGYLINPKSKTGYLKKQANGLYKTVRKAD